MKTIAAQDDLTVKRLTSIGAPTTARYDLVTLLSHINKSAVLAYRHESDAAHAGNVGRLLQRGTGEDPDLDSVRLSVAGWVAKSLVGTGFGGSYPVKNRIGGPLWLKTAGALSSLWGFGHQAEWHDSVGAETSNRFSQTVAAFLLS
jgi:hypothetical protein